MLAFFGCNSAKNKMETNRTITDIFDKSEIKDLEIIVNFFNEQIGALNGNENASIEKRYQDYFKYIKDQEIPGTFYLNISYQEQQKMYSQISKTTFEEIWSFSEYTSFLQKDSVEYGVSISYNFKGKYVTFLEAFGKDNKDIYLYLDNIKRVGDISPSAVAAVMLNYNLFNVKDIRIQLFIAIHYLTLNDQNERRDIIKTIPR